MLGGHRLGTREGRPLWRPTTLWRHTKPSRSRSATSSRATSCSARTDSTYDDDASFLESGIIDSFGFMELLQWVEEEFSLSVADDELVPDNFDSVHNLSSFILRKKSDGA